MQNQIHERPEQPHEWSDPEGIVVNRRDPRTGLSRRRSRVRIPSLPSVGEAVSALLMRARSCSEPSICQDCQIRNSPPASSIESWSPSSSYSRKLHGTTEMDGRGVGWLTGGFRADHDFPDGLTIWPLNRGIPTLHRREDTALKCNTCVVRGEPVGVEHNREHEVVPLTCRPARRLAATRWAASAAARRSTDAVVSTRSTRPRFPRSPPGSQSGRTARGCRERHRASRVGRAARSVAVYHG
jgi:hypothetical protein